MPPKEKKPKKISIAPIEKDHVAYDIASDLIAKHHDHLAEASIALEWRYGWNEDKDGRLILGQCRKVGDLDREFHGYDFVILLNYEACNTDKGFTKAQFTALIDHELCHAAVSVDENGEEKRDEKGRLVYRIRKHDIEEFREVVNRHGLYKGDLVAFAQACMEKQAKPLLNIEDAEKAS